MGVIRLNRGMIRDTRLLDKSNWDDPFQYCEAGSMEEADMLCEWSKDELVDEIQKLDEKLWALEKRVNKYCKNCDQTLPISAFENNGYSEGHRWICRSCRGTMNRVRTGTMNLKKKLEEFPKLYDVCHVHKEIYKKRLGCEKCH